MKAAQIQINSEPEANTQAQQNVPYRLRPKMHNLVREALAQKELMFDLMEKYGSPLNLVFPQIFHEKYELFDQMLSGEHLNYRLYYTCKPNRSNGLLAEAASMNAHVDVSSLGEFQAALEAGIDPAKISATGPKNKAYMDIVLEHQSLCVIDNLNELSYIAAKAQKGQPCMLRLSVPQTTELVPDDTFGVSYADLDSVIDILLARPELDFHGFATHYNYTSYEGDTTFHHIEQVVRATLEAFEKGLQPKAINIGGGYLIGYVECNREWNAFLNTIKLAIRGETAPVTWDNAGMGYRIQNNTVIGSPGFLNHYQSITAENHLEKILYNPLKCLDGVSLLDFIRDSGLSLYMEPGRALMDQAGVTLANVNFTKKSSKDNLLINLDMHYGNLNAHTFKFMAEPVLIHRNENLPVNEEGVFYYGSLCFASDLITFHKTFPDHLPEIGDIAAFINTAAYRMDFTESEMLRHPNAQKICLTQENGQWVTCEDNDYKKDKS
jgi:diaminopimelate decarboxylase